MRSASLSPPSRLAILLLLVSFAAVLAVTWRVDPRAAGVKGDEATYIAMAASLAFDGDLRFDGDDYQRFRAWFGSGPEGIFLKRDDEGRLHFGKAYVYGVLAAPFAWGGPRGLLVFNLLCLLATIVAGWWWLARRSSNVPAACFSLLFATAAVTPIYTAWLTSDLLTYALVFIAFAAGWPAGDEPAGPLRLVAAIVLLAAAIFSKPLNVFLALPFAMAGAASLRSRLGVLAGCAAAVIILFGVNALLSGELNYQGGDRKSFYGHFPYDEHGHDFDSAGITMATDTVNTPVGAEGRLATVFVNAGYFVVGRHFGLLTFGWTWLLCVVWWGMRSKKRPREWVLAASAAAIAAVTIVWMPYTWSGGGGPVGNRYFLSAGAALFFLTPALRSWIPVALALVGLVFVAPALAQPLRVAKEPWLATRAPQFALFPIELTGASDLPIVLDQRRGRVPQGHDPTLFASLIDARSEVGRSGWIAVDARSRSEILVRSPEPIDGVTLGVKSAGGCTVLVNGGRSEQPITVASQGREDARLAVRHVFSREAFVFVLEIDAGACAEPIEIAFQAYRTPAAAGI